MIGSNLTWRHKAVTQSGIQIFDVKLFDQSRKREIRCRHYVPSAKGPWPLVIVSHGTGGSDESYAYLGEALARAGFLAVHPNHPGSDKAVLKTVRFSQNQQAILEASLDPQNWRDRPADITFLLDQWAEAERQIPEIRGKVDLSRIAVVGHSMGAYTALALAGAAITFPQGKKSFTDSRIQSIVAISPAGPGQIFDMESFRTVQRPVLCITGSKDEGLRGEPPSWRVEGFEALPLGRKDLAFIEGATHLSFVDAMPFNDLPYVRDITSRATVAFLDAHLRGDDRDLMALRRGVEKNVKWRRQ